MSNRIFREAHERTLPPEGRDVMWLRPTDGSYTALVYKPEDGKWVSLNRTSWSDLLDVPGAFRSEETIRELVKEMAAGSVSDAVKEAVKDLMADDVAYRYGGGVEVWLRKRATTATGNKMTCSYMLSWVRLMHIILCTRYS